MSLYDTLTAIAADAGIADMRRGEFVQRGLAALPDDAQTVDIVKWLGTLRTDASHLFIVSTVNDMQAQARERVLANHPAERTTQARSQLPVVEKQQRSGPVSEAAAAAFAKLSVEDFNKLDRYKRIDYARQLQAQNGQG